MTPILNSTASQSLGALVTFTRSGSEISGTTTNGNFRVTIFNESVFKVSISKTAFENFSYAVVGFSEEASKFLGLRFYSYRQKSFDEPLDGIVYSVMVSMGFATLENVMYVMKYAEAGQGLHQQPEPDCRALHRHRCGRLR